MCCLVFSAFFLTHCSLRPAPVSTVITHFQAPPSFFFLGRDWDPAPSFSTPLTLGFLPTRPSVSFHRPLPTYDFFLLLGRYLSNPAPDLNSFSRSSLSILAPKARLALSTVIALFWPSSPSVSFHRPLPTSLLFLSLGGAGFERSRPREFPCFFFSCAAWFSLPFDTILACSARPQCQLSSPSFCHHRPVSAFIALFRPTSSLLPLGRDFSNPAPGAP